MCTWEGAQQYAILTGKDTGKEEAWWTPCFARMSRTDLRSGSKEFWPMVIEKGFAKFFGTYSAIEGGRMGDVLQYLTAGVIRTCQVTYTYSLRDTDR